MPGESTSSSKRAVVSGKKMDKDGESAIFHDKPFKTISLVKYL